MLTLNSGVLCYKRILFIYSCGVIGNVFVKSEILSSTFQKFTHLLRQPS